jgi:hypothetical protein
VLYADIAGGGGTSIYVDERELTDLRRFPDRAGYLERGDEGVIVADVDLGFVRTGRSTRYGDPPAIVPVAEASLVYRAHPIGEQYAAFLEDLATRLDGAGEPDLDAAAGRVEAARDLLLNAGALPAHRPPAAVAAAPGRDRQRHARRGAAAVHARGRPAGDLLPLPACGRPWPRGRPTSSSPGCASGAEAAWRRSRSGSARPAEPVATPEAALDRGGRAGHRAVSEAVQEPPHRPDRRDSATTSRPAWCSRRDQPAALGRRRHKDLILLFRPTPEDWFTRCASTPSGPRATPGRRLFIDGPVVERCYSCWPEAEGAERIAVCRNPRSVKEPQPSLSGL